MTKTVFISYAHEELPLAEMLKHWIKKIWQACEVFISASHESISGGEDWRKKLQQEIPRANVFFSLVGPSTQERPWIHFEAGAAWAHDVEVVPILHSGLEAVPTTMTKGQALRVSDPTFPEAFFNTIDRKCGFGGVPRISKDFSKQLQKAAEQIRGPREVVSLWNEALRQKNVAKARELTSRDTSDDFIKQRYGGWEQLMERYQSVSLRRYIHEATYGENYDAARVVYYVVYDDPPSYTIRRYEDVVLLEDEKWKVAPQWVVTTQLRPVKGSSRLLPVP